MSSFGEIRSLLHQPPSSHSWVSLCEALRAMPADERLDQALSYAESILSRWPDHLRLMPERWMDTIGPVPSLEELHPAAPLARALVFDVLDDARIDEILLSELVSPLHIISFESSSGFGQRARARLTTLVHSPYLDALAHLSLWGRHLRASGIMALADARWLEQLRSLNLGANYIGDEGLRELLSWTEGRLSGLETLFLAHSDLSDAGARALAYADLDGLRYLELGENFIGAQGALTLVNALNFTSLEALMLPRNAIGDAGAIALSRAHSMRRLKALDLCHNELTDLGIIALAKSPHLGALVHLDLEGSRITDQGATALVDARRAGRLPKLERLLLASDQLQLGPRATDALLSAFGAEVVQLTPALAQLNPKAGLNHYAPQGDPP